MFKSFIRSTYWPLIIAAAGLAILGTIFIYSASAHDSGNYLTKHFFWLGIALIVLLSTPLLGYRTFLSLSYLFYTAVIVMLLWVLIGGKTHLGAQRWIHIGPLVLQPSELAKIATIVALANFLGSNQAGEYQMPTILKATGLVLLPCALIIKQPDLGTTLLFIPILIFLLWMWGIRYRILALTGLMGAIAVPFFWFLMKPYQKQRILVFLDPSKDPLGSGYTAIQSKIAVGSGSVLGKGYLQGTQSQLQFVPEHHTDFIFCVLGEEWGFVGALILLALYIFLFRSGFKVMTCTTDIKAKLMITGVLVTIFSQVFINIGMSIGLMPITGLTLPLVSYGGSSLVTTAFGLGLILSVYRERSIF